MTPILKKQLTLLCAATILSGVLLWNVSGLRAQNMDGEAIRSAMGIKTARIKLTRDEAAKNFVKLLEELSGESARRYTHYGVEPSAEMMSSFSRKSETENFSAFLNRMATQWKQPNQTVKVESEGAQTATVTVETSSQPASRPLVLIQEGDSWGVDVVETYALWNNLEGAAKTEAIARISSEFNGERENARRSSCQSNLKQISLGILQYVQDYDEKYPPAKAWIDITLPYLKSEQIYKCPAVTDAKGYGYAYNSKLSLKPINAVSSPAETVSVYETTVLKRNAYGMGENRAFRHLGGANYAFTDGHIKWFAQSSKTPSFKLKP